jgi:hypothetical protein
LNVVSEFLENKGFTLNNFASRIHQWNSRTVVRFVEDIYELLQDEEPKKLSDYSFIANSQLSGGIFPCSEVECRLAQADRLCRFAALYADTVAVQNPLADLYGSGRWSLEMAKHRVSGGTAVLLYLKPLLDAGIVSVVNPHRAWCEAHLPEIVKSGALKKIEESLLASFDTGVTVSTQTAGPYVHFEGPLVEHALVIMLTSDDDLRRLVRQQKRGGRLTQKERRHYLSTSFVKPIIQDVVQQSVFAAGYNLTYLTDRSADFVAFRSLLNEPERHVSRVLTDAVTHSVPTLQELTIKDLLRIRRTEGAAFKVYRDSLRRLLGTKDVQKGNHVKEAFNDLVSPELHKIDAVVEKEQRRRRPRLVTDLLIGYALIGVGYFTHLLPELLQASGPFQVDAAHQLRNLFTEPADARNNPFYFLWKADKKARYTIRRRGASWA